jgi:hypothetical protein
MDRNWNYILNGHDPVPEPDIHKWGRWLSKANRVVAKTQIGDAEISTVFLGTDHNWLGHPPPILFETMVFGLPYAHEPCIRYATWDEAEAGHSEMVERVRRMYETHDVEL